MEKTLFPLLNCLCIFFEYQLSIYMSVRFWNFTSGSLICSASVDTTPT